MKNIYLLPTDKPSKLVLSNNSILTIIEESNYNFSHIKSAHIYITSDKKIKEGDWCIYHSGEIVQYLVKLNTDNLKKIILTTDQGLIADGVQSIDDEFLDWFVKNTSCEEVYILDDYEQVNQDNPITRGSTNVVHKYKIFIPQEELKQLTDLEIAIKLEEIEREEPKQEQKKHLIDIMQEDEKLGLYNEPKQETLEEVALNYSIYNEQSNKAIQEAVKFGAKWQSERMYSEVDMKEAFIKGAMTDMFNTWGISDEDMAKEKFVEWFEKYKK